MSSQAIKITDPLAIKAPDIAYQPEKAFYPLRLDPSDGKIKPSYQNDICIKEFVVCWKYEKRLLYFPSLEWFLHNGFGLYKIPDIK